jgi:hypothetical protein
MNNNIIQNKKQNNKYLQYVYLSIALSSTYCVMTNSYIIPCTNILGIMCFFDLYFVKRIDMFLHHVLVLGMIHYMNYHSDIKTSNEIISVLLSTEISTIFLTINNLLENVNNINFFKNINKFMFISTFFYYRIYNYGYYLILDKNNYYIFLSHSNYRFEFYEMYYGMHSLYIINLYWFGLILNKLVQMYKK